VAMPRERTNGSVTGVNAFEAFYRCENRSDRLVHVTALRVAVPPRYVVER